jgi:membrane-associated phospholipid phosphatase
MVAIKTSKKIAITLLLIIYFVIGYFGVGFLPHYTSINATTSLDRIIPLISFFIIFYLLGFIFAVIPAFFLKTKKEFFSVAKIYFWMLTISFLFFILLPIEIKRDFVIGQGFFAWGISFLKTIDTSFNNFPSIHVALNLFAFLLIKDKNKKISKWLLPVLILIIISTLFTKQHIILDVIAGLVFGFIFYERYKRSIK